MNFVALRMLTGDRAKYFGLIFAIAFCTFLLENQTSIFANIMKRTAHQVLDVTDAEIGVMDPKSEYWEQTRPLANTDLARVRGVAGVLWAVRLFKGTPVARTSTGRFAAAILIGLDDATLTGAPRKMLMGSWQRLREPQSIVVDKGIPFVGESARAPGVARALHRRPRQLPLSARRAALGPGLGRCGGAVGAECGGQPHRGLQVARRRMVRRGERDNW